MDRSQNSQSIFIKMIKYIDNIFIIYILAYSKGIQN